MSYLLAQIFPESFANSESSVQIMPVSLIESGQVVVYDCRRFDLRAGGKPA